MDDIKALIEMQDDIQPIATAKPKRMIDRLYTLTATYPDGSVETIDASHTSINRYRAWYRINKPEAKVEVEETQTFATSDGKTYKELTFEANPSLKHAPNGTLLQINEVDPKPRFIGPRLHDLVPLIEVPPSVYSGPKPTARDIEAKRKAEAKRTALFNKMNAKGKSDQNLRIFQNGSLTFSGSLVDGLRYMKQNNITFKNATIYLPEKLQGKFEKHLDAIRQGKAEEKREARAMAKEETKAIVAAMQKEG